MAQDLTSCTSPMQKSAPIYTMQAINLHHYNLHCPQARNPHCSLHHVEFTRYCARSASLPQIKISTSQGVWYHVKNLSKMPYYAVWNVCRHSLMYIIHWNVCRVHSLQSHMIFDLGQSRYFT